MAVKCTHMSASKRCEQLIAMAHGLSTKHGFDTTSVEEVTTRAQVFEPVVYRYFGSKEDLYTVVVGRKVTMVSAAISSAIADSAVGIAMMPEAKRRTTEGPDASGSALRIAERAALALLVYTEDPSNGFRVLPAGSDHTASAHSTLLVDIAIEVPGTLASQFVAHDLDPRTAPLRAQMLVGIVAIPARWQLEDRSTSKEEVVAHMVNLAWNGLCGMEVGPILHSRPADNSHDSEDALGQGIDSRTESATHHHSATSVTESPGAP